MPDKYEDALRVLGLEPGASEQAVKDAYRDLVKVWHPDRFGSDARLREKAQDKLKEVNAAFEHLRGYRASDSRRPPQPARPPEPASDFSGWHVPEPVVKPASHGRARYALIFLLFTVLTAIVATNLFMSRGRAPAPEQLSPAPEMVQEPPPAPPSPAPVPTVRQPVRRAPEAPPPRAIESARDSIPASATRESTPAPATRESPAPATRESTSAPATRESTPAPATGSLIVTSRPVGAHVSFDGRVVGETPIVVTDVTPGEHRIELTLDGNAYQPWSSWVVVSAGREEKLLAVMTPTGRPPKSGGNTKH